MAEFLNSTVNHTKRNKLVDFFFVNQSSKWAKDNEREREIAPKPPFSSISTGQYLYSSSLRGFLHQK
jgi:hypothetical protein